MDKQLIAISIQQDVKSRGFIRLPNNTKTRVDSKPYIGLLVLH